MSDVEKFENDEAYFADKSYMSNSSFKLLRQSPTKFYLWRTGKWNYPTTSFFDVGTALHALFLENKDVAIRWEGTRRGNDYKFFKESNADKLVLPSKEYDLVQSMNDKLNNIPEVVDLMGFDYQAEVPMTSTYITASGLEIPVKGKADAIVDNGEEKYIVDLKTTAKSLEEFKKSARWMLYTQQAALYTRLFNVDKFVFLVVEKEFPYEVGIFECSTDFLQQGEWELEFSANKYEKLFVKNEFKPYNAIIDTI